MYSVFSLKKGMLAFFFCSAIFVSDMSENLTLQSRSSAATGIADTTKITYLRGLIDSTQIILNLDELPEGAMQTITTINVRNMDVQNLLRGLGSEYDLNVIVSNDINRKVTVNLTGLPVIEALLHICKRNNLSLMQSGQVLEISAYDMPEDKPKIPKITMSDDGLLTLDLKNDNLKQVVRKLSQLTSQNIVIRNGVSGELNGFLQNVAFEVGFETILANNGFSLRERDDIYVVDRAGMQGSSGKSKSGQNFWVNVENGLISLDVVSAPITDLVREIAYQTNVNIVTYSLPEGILTAKTNNLTLEETFSYLFRGTNVTYRKEGNIYVIGDKSTSGIATNELIRLKHIRADVVMEMLPESVRQGATVELIKEQNGLMVIGTNDIIRELRSFIQEIDHPTPQILIEALVIDINSSDLFELGVTLAKGAAPDSSFLNPFAIFGARGPSGRQSGGVVAQGDGTSANKWFGSGGSLFGIRNFGKLPADFFFRIQALSQEGIVNMRSRPQISTLNGHKASIEIGTKQYFILKSTTPLQSPNQIITQESERFETIEANVSLEITPWVSSAGEVTAEIHPEFNTPVGDFSSQVPPTINSRILNSTVRLKDGETIILGGLIQDTETVNHNKIPIIGDIPLLGQLFRNRSHDNSKSELIIFITPHVFYGEGNDAAQWRRLKEGLEIGNNEIDQTESEEEK